MKYNETSDGCKCHSCRRNINIAGQLSNLHALKKMMVSAGTDNAENTVVVDKLISDMEKENSKQFKCRRQPRKH